MCLIRAKLDCHDSLSPIFAWRAKGYRCCVNSIKTGRLIEQCSLKISRSFLWKKKAFIWKRIIFKRPGMVPKSLLERTFLKGKKWIIYQRNSINWPCRNSIISIQQCYFPDFNLWYLILFSINGLSINVPRVTYSPISYYRVGKLEFMAFLVLNLKKIYWKHFKQITLTLCSLTYLINICSY